MNRAHKESETRGTEHTKCRHHEPSTRRVRREEPRTRTPRLPPSFLETQVSFGKQAKFYSSAPSFMITLTPSVIPRKVEEMQKILLTGHVSVQKWIIPFRNIRLFRFTHLHHLLRPLQLNRLKSISKTVHELVLSCRARLFSNGVKARRHNAEMYYEHC